MPTGAACEPIEEIIPLLADNDDLGQPHDVGCTLPYHNLYRSDFLLRKVDNRCGSGLGRERDVNAFLSVVHKQLAVLTAFSGFTLS
jgi:hypothetical protein